MCLMLIYESNVYTVQTLTMMLGTCYLRAAKGVCKWGTLRKVGDELLGLNSDCAKIFLHVTAQCNIYNANNYSPLSVFPPSVLSTSLVNSGLIISGVVPFWLSCSVHPHYVKREPFLKLGDVKVATGGIGLIVQACEDEPLGLDGNLQRCKVRSLRKSSCRVVGYVFGRNTHLRVKKENMIRKSNIRFSTHIAVCNR
jgi:hypothetical protein